MSIHRPTFMQWVALVVVMIASNIGTYFVATEHSKDSIQEVGHLLYVNAVHGCERNNPRYEAQFISTNALAHHGVRPETRRENRRALRAIETTPGILPNGRTACHHVIKEP